MKKILIALLIFSMILLGLDALAQTGLGDSFLDDPPQEESNPFDDPNTLTAEQMMGDLDQFEANFDDLMKNPKSAAQIAEIYANKNNGDFAKVSHLFNDYTEATGNDKLKADLNKGTEGSYKDGTLEVAEANSLGTESESKTSIEGTNIKDGKITEDGTFSAGSLEEGSIATPDFVLGEGDSGLDASFTEMNFQNAENIEVQPNGNFRADSMESLSLSRPQFQLYMDDTQHIRKKALPVKATELKNAKNVEYRDGILKAEAADTVTIDGAESKRVFDLTVTPAELDVSIPSEYINVPALKFEQAQSLTVAGYQYNNIKDVVAVIQDNMILYIQLTSGADNNELTFPNPIPRSPKEIAIILQKDKDLQYLLKDTDVKIITTLKELVLKSLTPAEIKILYDDFVRKRGLNAVRNTESDTVYFYLEDMYKRFTLNLMPVPTEKIEVIKNIFNGFYSNQALQNKIFDLLTEDEQNNLVNRFIVMKGYDLEATYSDSQKRSFVYQFLQKALINKFIDSIDSVSKDKILQIKSLLTEKTVTKKGKQINIVTGDTTTTGFLTDDKRIINSTTDGNGKLFVTEGTPPAYSFVNQTVNFNHEDFRDEVMGSEDAATAEIDEDFGFECMTLVPNSEFFYHDNRLEKSFSVVSPEFYSLCIKRDQSQIIDENLLCENCGYVNFVNRSIVLNGIVNYGRIPFYFDNQFRFYSNDFFAIYESYDEKNNGIFVMDDDFIMVNFLLLQDADNAQFYYGYYRIAEKDGKTIVSLVEDPRAKAIEGFVGKDMILQESAGALTKKDSVVLTDKDAQFTKGGLLDGFFK